MKNAIVSEEENRSNGQKKDLETKKTLFSAGHFERISLVMW